MPAADHEAVWARERSFHDALAGRLDIEALDRSRTLDGIDVALLELAGDVCGRTVLDAGCGQGDLTVALLERGARVTALDLSPGMVDVVRSRVGRLGDLAHSFTAVAAPLERSGLAQGDFDLVLGKFILHHVDVENACVELQRLLRPGGRAIFIENAGDNPVLAFARNHIAGRFGVPRFGTEDEHPLLARDVAALRPMFARVDAHYPVFECFVLFDRQVLRFRYRRLSRIIRWIDGSIHRHAPHLRRFSYRVIVELEAWPKSLL